MTFSKQEFVGYHGTFQSNITNILENGFIYNKRDDHWLGQGIYFYTEFQLAKWWIERKIKSLNLKENVSVIESYILKDKKILNLDDPKDVDFFFSALKDILEEIKSNGITLKFKKGFANQVKNRCLGLDLVKKKHSIDVIIRTFDKNNPTYGKTNIVSFENEYFPMGITYNETQICISNNDCISSNKCIYPIDKYSYNKMSSTITTKKKGRLV